MGEIWRGDESPLPHSPGAEPPQARRNLTKHQSPFHRTACNVCCILRHKYPIHISLGCFRSLHVLYVIELCTDVLIKASQIEPLELTNYSQDMRLGTAPFWADGKKRRDKGILSDS